MIIEKSEAFTFLLEHYNKQSKIYGLSLRSLEDVHNCTQKRLIIINKGINLYYRNTQYTPRDKWKPVRLEWVLDRDNIEYSIEVCILVTFPEYPVPWFVKNDNFGTGELVVEIL